MMYVLTNPSPPACTLTPSEILPLSKVFHLLLCCNYCVLSYDALPSLFFARRSVYPAKSVMWPDKWTAATADGRRTAQFEHTFLMTAEGAEPLTAKLDSSPRQFWEKN